MNLRFWKRSRPEMPPEIRELRYKDGVLEITTANQAFVDLASAAIEAYWVENGSPPNQVCMTVWCPNIGDSGQAMTVTVRKYSSGDPAQQVGELVAENKALKAEIERLRTVIP